MEYPLWKLLRKDVIERLAIKKGKHKYEISMGFDTRKDARSYLQHHKRKGMRGFIRKIPQELAWQFTKIKWVVYENWD